MTKEIYRTCIYLKKGGIVSKNGTKDEIESFILENMDSAKRWRTCNKKNNSVEIDLCGTN